MGHCLMVRAFVCLGASQGRQGVCSWSWELQSAGRGETMRSEPTGLRTMHWGEEELVVGHVRVHLLLMQCSALHGQFVFAGMSVGH